jgi:hypothetical protein
MKNNGKLVACPGNDSGEIYERVGQWTLTPAFRNGSSESPPSMRKIHQQSRLHSKTTDFKFSTDVLPVASDLRNVPRDGFFLATPSEIEEERSAGQMPNQQDLKSENKDFISGADDPVQTGFVPICDHDDYDDHDGHDGHDLRFPATRFLLKPRNSTPSVKLENVDAVGKIRLYY